jgi:hypothetical protein
MKTTMWLAPAPIVLFVGAFVVVTKEPFSADQDSPQVIRIGAMSVERAAHQATLLKTGQVLVTGGCAGRGCNPIHASAELYDPVTRSFQAAAAMATPRASHAAVVLPDGRVLVSGGWTGRDATASAEIYDPATSRWTSADDMSVPRMSPIAAPLPGGRVLMLGGEVTTGAPLASAEVFDPTTSTFSAVGPMQTPRGSHVAVPLADGLVLVIGGHRARGEILRSAETFDPATGEFQPTGNMAVSRHKHAAALLADGRVLIIGGSDARDYRGRYASTEIYDPEMGVFSSGPDMRWGRHKIRDAVAVLPSGAVLVAGGAAQPELFDPAVRIFVATQGELSGPQMFATATLLPTGEVLILGGYDDTIQSSASAWLVGTTR